MAKAIVITGTPGTGKSTVARLLAERLGAELVELGELAVREGFCSGLDEERGTLIVDTDLLAQRVSELLAAGPSGGLLVVVGHYAQHVVPREHLLMAFVLRRHPLELRRVLEARGYRGRKLHENLLAEALDVCLVEAVQAYGPELVYELDITGRGPEDVLAELLEALKAREGRVGVVDWLGQLEQEGTLDEVLKPL